MCVKRRLVVYHYMMNLQAKCYFIIVVVVKFSMLDAKLYNWCKVLYNVKTIILPSIRVLIYKINAIFSF